MSDGPSASQASDRKRHRADSYYPRRRNLVACNVCRGRKSKCDNARPSCGFCMSIGADCVYEETRSDYSNYDSASLHIIRQLDALEKRMDERFDQFASHQPSVAPKESVQPEVKVAMSTLSLQPVVEATLEWPVFSYLNLELHGRSLALVHDLQPDPQHQHATDDIFGDLEFNRSIIQTALDDFLRNVHSKNPVLDPQVLARAREDCVSYGGFDNRPESALVVIACALGIISTAYGPAGTRQYEQDASEADALRPLADRCFSKARAILGVQPPSLIVTQCLFFCGVYDMFSLRPVSAWLHFSQASLQLKLHIQSRIFSADEYLSADGRLIQRLYWSCMQSECELANELRISSSGLENVPFPYAFPNPPDNVTADAQGSRSGDLKSWMYYLSETSLRRICNEVLLALYDQRPAEWMSDIAAVAAQAESLQEKLEAWFHNVPEDLRVDAGHIFESFNELGLHVRSRYLMCRYWIFRPFIYFMVHAGRPELQRHRALVEPLAYTGLECALEMINDATHHHRHHGTWYTARLAVGGALALLAAARTNSIGMPPGWRDSVKQTEQIVGVWSGESKNLQVSLEILQRIQQNY